MHMTLKRKSIVAILERRALLRNLEGHRRRERRGDMEELDSAISIPMSDDGDLQPYHERDLSA